MPLASSELLGATAAICVLCSPTERKPFLLPCCAPARLLRPEDEHEDAGGAQVLLLLPDPEAWQGRLGQGGGGSTEVHSLLRLHLCLCQRREPGPGVCRLPHL